MKRYTAAVLCVALSTPVTAFALDFGAATADAFLVPQAELERRGGGNRSAEIGGDGVGAKGFAHLGDLAIVSAEIQSVSQDNGDDRESIRIGGGLGRTTGTGFMVELISSSLGDSDAEGIGAHARLGGGVGRMNFHLMGGYVLLEDENERFGGFEMSLGSSFRVYRNFAALLDYRLTNLEGDETQLELKFRDLRFGVRYAFGGSDGGGEDGGEDVNVIDAQTDAEAGMGETEGGDAGAAEGDAGATEGGAGTESDTGTPAEEEPE